MKLREHKEICWGCQRIQDQEGEGSEDVRASPGKPENSYQETCRDHEASFTAEIKIEKGNGFQMRDEGRKIRGGGRVPKRPSPKYIREGIKEMQCGYI